MDNRRRWSFVLDQEQTWIWRVTAATGESKESQAKFATLKDCTTDAMSHGYVAWKSENERRRGSTLGVTKVLARRPRAGNLEKP